MKKAIKLAVLVFFLFAFPAYSQTNFPSRHFLQKTDINSLKKSNHHPDSFLQSQILNKSNKTGDAVFLLDYKTGLIWDTTNLNWENYGKYSYTYDANNNLIEELEQHWYDDIWNNNSDTSYTYDANNNLITRLYQEWYEGNWVNTLKWSYTYDANNNLIVKLWQYWDGANWGNVYKCSYTYDANNNLIMQLEQDWNGADSNWEDYWKYSYTYDANNNLIVELDQVWFGANWLNNLKWSYTYDTNNNLIVKLDQIWIFSNWVNDIRWSYTYDANNNLILELEQQEGNYWKYSYTYDANNNLIEKLCQQENGSNWVNYEKYSYTYMQVTGITGQSETIPKDFSLSQNYPNPFNPSTIIKYELPKESFVTIKVFDLLGREVKTLVNENKSAGSYSVEFNSQNLPSGIYFYWIKAGVFVQTKKMVLLK